MVFDFEGWEKKWYEDRLVRCPHCNEEQSGETTQALSTFFGHMGEWEQAECDACGKEFFVEELVDRTFNERGSLGEEDVLHER